MVPHSFRTVGTNYFGSAQFHANSEDGLLWLDEYWVVLILFATLIYVNRNIMLKILICNLIWNLATKLK